MVKKDKIENIQGEINCILEDLKNSIDVDLVISDLFDVVYRLDIIIKEGAE